MPLEQVKPKKFHSNKIKFAIDRMVAEKEDDSYREVLIDEIKEGLGLSKGSKKVYMFINNTVQPTVQELAIIAQVLCEHDLWDLIKLED